MKNKSFLFFGIFDESYARNRVLVNGLKDIGCEVTLCRIDPRVHSTLGKYFALYLEYKKVVRNKRFDHVIVAFPGHGVVWLAYLLFGRNIIFDVFVSLYNSEIEDRRSHSKFSFRAFYYWFLDKYSMSIPFTVLSDTDTHANYLSEKFNVPRGKFIRVFVGSDDSIVYPIKSDRNSKFTVHFHGSGIPLQGISHIIDAANELRNLQDVKFHLHIPKTDFLDREKARVKEMGLDNVLFKGVFPISDISRVLSNADVVLGIFGETIKAQNVIPNKAYEAWASRKPLITSKTPAILELMTERENVLFCNIADGRNLAEKILFLKNDSGLREKIAQNGYEEFCVKLRPGIIARKLLSDLKPDI